MVTYWSSSNQRSCSTSGPVSTRMGNRLQVGKPSQYVASHPAQLSLAISTWVGTMNAGKSWLVNLRSLKGYIIPIYFHTSIEQVTMAPECRAWSRMSNISSGSSSQKLNTSTRPPVSNVNISASGQSCSSLYDPQNLQNIVSNKFCNKNPVG